MIPIADSGSTEIGGIATDLLCILLRKVSDLRRLPIDPCVQLNNLITSLPVRDE